VAYSFEHDNETSVSAKAENFWPAEILLAFRIRPWDMVLIVDINLRAVSNVLLHVVPWELIHIHCEKRCKQESIFYHPPLRGARINFKKHHNSWRHLYISTQLWVNLNRKYRHMIHASWFLISHYLDIYFWDRKRDMPLYWPSIMSKCARAPSFTFTALVALCSLSGALVDEWAIS